MCISKTLSPRLRTIIQVTLISILYVLARMVSFQAHSSKKKTNRLAIIWCPPIKSLSLFFLYIAKQIEHKSQKSKNNTRVALCHETAEKKTPHIPKMAQFLKGGKNGHFTKAIAKQTGHKCMVYTGTEPPNTKNIQKLPFKIIRVVLCTRLLKNTLNIRKMPRR